MNVYARRLLNVALATREASRPDLFRMGAFFHYDECGTPACAFGNYVARTDLQDRFKRVNGGTFCGISVWYIGSSEDVPGSLCCFIVGSSIYEHIVDHFGVTHAEAVELFSAIGCGDAHSPAAAATYIEAFVARKWPETDVARIVLVPAYAEAA
jgi:hypothetical protein